MTDFNGKLMTFHAKDFNMQYNPKKPTPINRKRDNYETLYKYLTTNIDGEVIPLELGSKEALDKRVEKMLNEEGYAKSDFIIVRVVDYTIDATAYTNTDVNADTSNIDVTLLRAEK